MQHEIGNALHAAEGQVQALTHKAGTKANKAAGRISATAKKAHDATATKALRFVDDLPTLDSVRVHKLVQLAQELFIALS